MRNIRLEIEYDGRDYCGWQTQRKTNSIQQTLEKTLRKILQEKINLIASGRTDAGVHAQAQVANFKTNSDISLAKLQWAVNRLLPDDIKISKIKRVSPDFHSQFAAKAKLYRYSIINHNHSPVFLRNYVYPCPYPLDIELMRQEARCLAGRHDFNSFCASGSGAKNTIRTIKSISIGKKRYKGYGLITIDIEADGFLYNMVRNIVGTLIEVGRGKFKKGKLRAILSARDRRAAGQIAPARGLCLMKVKY